MTVNEKGLEAAQVAAREGCGLFIESQHVFCDDPVVGEAADGYGKPLRQPYCSCKGDAERIIKAYLRAASKDAEPVEVLLETAWQAILDGPTLTCPSTGADGGVKVKARALLDALHRYGFPVSDAAVKPLLDGGSLEAQRVHVAAIELRSALTAIEPVAASPGVPDGMEAVPDSSTIGG